MNPEPFYNSKVVRSAGVAVLILLALFLLAETISVAQMFGHTPYDQQNTVTVNADGKATLPPDVARITFTVQNNAGTVAGAQSLTNKQADDAISYVKGQGVADKDVKTLSYDVIPQYNNPTPCYGTVCPANTEPPKIIGYQVSETVQVTIRDLTKVGDLLAGIGKLSVQNVSGPAFTLDDTTAGYDAARTDAITKAKTQAQMLAKELGVSLGRIVTFNENTGGGNGPYPMDYAIGGGRGMAKAESVPTISPGQNTYTASVSITYEIR